MDSIEIIITGSPLLNPPRIDLTKNLIVEETPMPAITQTAGAKTKRSLTMTPLEMVREWGIMVYSGV